jgi:flavin-dependent dehydrogenase
MHDVVVCGAGPAGSVVAQRLAAAGLCVALVGGTARPGWEGLSSRSRGLLIEEGLDPQGDVISGPVVRRGVWGNGRGVEGVEWLMERAAIADALSAHARARGADYRADRVTSAKWAGDHWRVVLRNGEVLAASMVVDGQGREARSLLRGGVRCAGPVLLAIGQEFRRHGAGASGTGIGVTDTGWCWWAEHGNALWVQVIGKPGSLRPKAWVAAAAAQIPTLARALADAVPERAPVARAAHTQLGGVCGSADLEPTLWLAGDAAMALDPLSGQGVYEAVRGARLVATAIQSVTAGGDARLAQRFVAERREQAWLRGVRVAADFYRENERCRSR